MVKKILKRILPRRAVDYLSRVRNYFCDVYFSKSYSQEGEDMILKRIFEKQQIGFYVDVGAHHPKRFSNTYYFYKKGWSGINIDAAPGSMKLFEKIRPRDINIEKPISDTKTIMTYYSFNEPALNSFSKDLSEKRNNRNGYYIESTRDIETVTLEEVLDDNLPKLQEIDFLSIDVEGLDFLVLKSNNFKKYRPKVILIEILGSNIVSIQESKIARYLKDLDYTIFSKTVNTVLFIDNQFLGG